MTRIFSTRFAMGRALNAGGDGGGSITKAEMDAAISATRAPDGNVDGAAVDALATQWVRFSGLASDEAKQSYNAFMQSIGRDPNVAPAGVVTSSLPNGLALLEDGKYQLRNLELTKAGDRITVRDPSYRYYQTGNVRNDGSLEWSRDGMVLKGKLSFIPGSAGDKLRFEGKQRVWPGGVERTYNAVMEAPVVRQGIVIERRELKGTTNRDRSRVSTITLETNAEGGITANMGYLKVSVPVGPGGVINSNGITGKLEAQRITLTRGSETYSCPIPMDVDPNGALYSAMNDLGIGTTPTAFSGIPDGTYPIKCQSVDGEATVTLVKSGNRATLNGCIVEPDGNIHVDEFHGQSTAYRFGGRVELLGDDIISIQLRQETGYPSVGSSKVKELRGAMKLDGTSMTPEVERKPVHVTGQTTTISNAAESAGRSNASSVTGQVDIITMSPTELYVKLPHAITGDGDRVVPVGQDGRISYGGGNGVFSLSINGRLEQGKLSVDVRFSGSTLSRSTHVEGAF